MKILSVLAIAAIYFLSASSTATAQPQGNNFAVDEEYVGTLPAMAGNGQEASSKRHKVKPGQEHTNKDGVTVDNAEDSDGNAFIDPKKGTTGSSTTVDTNTGFEGEISGLDSNDTINIGSSNTVTVNTDGGTVNIGGGSSVTITTSPTGGTTTVNLNSGQQVSLPPGTTAIVFTT